MSAACFRRPEALMHSARLGAFHSSYLSFSRSLVRKMVAEKWQINIGEFGLDADGFGRVIYRVRTPRRVYGVLFLTNALDAALRNDRVIAQAWDMTFCLCDGDIGADDAAYLAQHLPHQEHGRYHPKVLSVSRANKSVRNFDYVVDCLAAGRQPAMAHLQQTGYLARTTAVYGNGKFGMADYACLQDGDFAGHFYAQLFGVYMARHFTADWVEHIARQKSAHTAVPLAANIRRFIGVGNSTGLGMMPFLIKHPQVVDAWVRSREQALFEIFESAEMNAAARTAFARYWRRAADFFAGFTVPDARQQQKNVRLCAELKAMNAAEGYDSWRALWAALTGQSMEVQELFLNILLEIYPQISAKYERFVYLPEQPLPDLSVTVAALMREVERHYDWALSVDFSRAESGRMFWYRSADKEEPRLGDRYAEAGAEREMKIGIAKNIRRLYDALAQQKNWQCSVTEFLFAHPHFAAEVQRVLCYPQQAFGEIRGNILDKDFYPIDLLRLKLSFFGAVKFDPKSSRWLRITLFQGAPLTDTQGVVSAPDDWFLYVFEQ